MAESAAFAAARDYFITQIKNGFTRVQVITALEKSGWNTDQLTALLSDPEVAQCLKEYSATIMYASDERLGGIRSYIRPVGLGLGLCLVLVLAILGGWFGLELKSPNLQVLREIVSEFERELILGER